MFGKVALSACCLLALGAAFADPEIVEMGSTHASEQIILKGVVLTKNPDLSSCEPAEGIHACEIAIPGGVGQISRHLEHFIGQPVTKNLLSQIQNEIQTYYQSQGNSLIRTSLPSQEVVDGTVYIAVNQVKINEIQWTNNKHFTNDQLQKDFSLHSGDELSEDTLLNDIVWKNRNPFHKTEAIIRPAAAPGTIDLELRTNDRRSVRVYVGADNTGTQYTGNDRIYAGLNWGNALGRGDLFIYQFTCNSTLDRFLAQFGQYVAFLPWRHVLTVYGGYAKTTPDVGADFRSKGTSGQASMRYSIPTKPYYTAFTQEYTAGIDWKYTNSNMFFVDFPLPLVTSAVNVLELIFNYGLEYKTKQNDLTFSLDGHFSPGHILPKQTDHNYDSLRLGAKVLYGFALASLSNEYTFQNKASLSAILRLTGATGPLLPMQQFSLGGYNTVRGYDEHAYLADAAACFNLELRSYPLNLYRKDIQLTFLGFVDTGVGHNYHQEGNLNATTYLLGAGPGVRLSVSTYLALRADYGFNLHHIPYDTNFGKFHLGGQLSF
ncbi:MAG: ShlB protein [Parachlamydiales bacterium]|nr:ShlB protein [Parachlamydiales bacterium]